jgi:hypothetical protein
MAGEAVTSKFLLSTATVMVGPSSKVMELSPALHSLGLIKNVQVTTDMQSVELTQGTQALTVTSVATSNQVKISGEIYEYSARNVAYAAGLDASGVAFDPSTITGLLSTAITVGGATVVLVSATGFAVGDTIVIQDTLVPDRLHVGLISVITTNTLTLAAGFVMPTTSAFPVATTIVYRMRDVKIGAVPSIPTFGVKLVGVMPDDASPVTLIFPKVRIMKGFQMSFQTDNFANMPFEFTPYALLSTDPYFAQFGSMKSFAVIRN